MLSASFRKTIGVATTLLPPMRPAHGRTFGRTLGRAGLYLAVVALALPAVSGCVSKRKYKDLEASLAANRQTLAQREAQATALANDTTAAAARYRALQNQYRALGSDAQNNEQYLSGQLEGKEAQLADQQRRLRDLQASLQRQQDAVAKLRSAVAQALSGFKADELTIENKNGKVYVSLQDKLLFPSGSIQVQPAGRDALAKLAEVLGRNPDIEVVVEGHTDNVPLKPGAAIKDNWDLSVLRATTIARFLSEKGLDAKRIEAAGRGEYFPAASNADAAGKARNRRTEIILSPRLDELYKIIGGSN